ncbi:hypothetical protein, partial [Erwinia amylovora]
AALVPSTARHLCFAMFRLDGELSLQAGQHERHTIKSRETGFLICFVSVFLLNTGRWIFFAPFLCDA